MRPVRGWDGGHRPVAATLALLLVAALGLVGCGRETPEKTLIVQEREFVRTVLVGTVRRTYLVHLPPTYRPGRPAPVVLNFHGGAQDVQPHQTLSRLDVTAARHGFVTVYPRGTRDLLGGGRSWNAGSCCAHAQQSGAADIDFTTVLLQDLATKVTVDPRRIYAIGMSNGGMLAYRLACELSSRIAAVAVVAGSLTVPACRPERPISVLHIHGTADELVPVEGGVGTNPVLGEFRSLEDSLAVFRRRNRCPATPIRVVEADATLTRWTDCSEGTEVLSCLVSAGGHTWPGGAPFPPGGTTSTRTPANELAWAFFARHPLPADEEPSETPEEEPEEEETP